MYKIYITILSAVLLGVPAVFANENYYDNENPNFQFDSAQKILEEVKEQQGQSAEDIKNSGNVNESGEAVDKINRIIIDENIPSEKDYISANYNSYDFSEQNLENP